MQRLSNYCCLALAIVVGCGQATEPTTSASVDESQAGEAAKPSSSHESAELAAEPASAVDEATETSNDEAMKSSASAAGTAQDASSSDYASSDDASSDDAEANFAAGIAAYQSNDLVLAFKKFQTAAKQGHADSQFNLGLMYEQGIGVERNEMQAVAWYGQSATQGNSAAQFNLGVLYENGRGTAVNFEQANKWYRLASVQGDPLAIGNLGMLYIRGDGVPVDKVAGVALLFTSATMDPSPSNNARRNITGTRGLSAEMIAAAQQLSGELSAAKNMLVPLDRFLSKSSSKAADNQ
ncbi:MAG: hypothetical protein Aurels2KO_41050 [Aureliella sp.]